MVAISGNFNSFNALLQLNRAQNGQDDAILRLSDGNRIQDAEDDPSGLAISGKLRSEIKSIQHLKRTHFEGVSSIQLADANLEELSGMLSRISELATQAASELSLSGQASAALNSEFNQIIQQIDDLDEHLRFNDIPLFGANPASFTIPADVDPLNTSEDIVINFSSFSAATLGLGGADLSTPTNASAILPLMDNIIQGVSRKRGNLAAMQRRLEENMDNLDERMVALQDQDIAIRGTDVATETVNLTRQDILNRSNLSVIAQTNLNPDRVFQLLN